MTEAEFRERLEVLRRMIEGALGVGELDNEAVRRTLAAMLLREVRELVEKIGGPDG